MSLRLVRGLQLLTSDKHGRSLLPLWCLRRLRPPAKYDKRSFRTKQKHHKRKPKLAGVVASTLRMKTKAHPQQPTYALNHHPFWCCCHLLLSSWSTSNPRHPALLSSPSTMSCSSGGMSSPRPQNCSSGCSALS
jgi:hypothetical protein